MTTITLSIFITLLLSYLIFIELALRYRQGETLIKVALKRKNRIDSLIFLGLIGIALYTQRQESEQAVSYLLFIVLALVIVYSMFIRTPQLLCKSSGFIYNNLYFPYAQITHIALTENHILVIELKTRRLLICVAHIDELTKLLTFFAMQDLQLKEIANY